MTTYYTPILWVTGIDSGREPSSHKNVMIISSVTAGGLIGDVEWLLLPPNTGSLVAPSDPCDDSSTAYACGIMELMASCKKKHTVTDKC